MLTSFGLLFLAGPILVWALWLRSQTVHLAWLTVSIGIVALLSLVIGWMSLAFIREQLGRGPERRRWISQTIVFGAAACLTLAVSMARTEWDPFGPSVTRHPDDPTVIQRIGNWFRPAVADLSNVRLTTMTLAWRPHDEAFRTFRRNWCSDLPDPSCLQQGLENGELNGAFDKARAREIAVMTKPDLSGRHMDHAKLFAAFLPGVTLDGARLRRADMHGAQMDGVRARDADMTASVLIYAQLDAANLRRATLVGATAYNLSAVNANFVSTDLRLANLANADFRYAILNNVDLSGANLDQTRFDGALLERARFAYAQLSGTSLDRSNLYGADLSHARLDFTQLADVKLSSAKFVNAIVSWTYVKGVADWPVGGVDFSGAALLGVTFQSLDLSQAAFEGPKQLNHTFADGSVLLPADMARPCHWSDEVLTHLDYMRHWRGVFDAMPYAPSWSSVVPEEFINVTPEPLPEDCVIHPFDDEVWRKVERGFFERRQAIVDEISAALR
ncbi:pentapeptide repeat-containing protein [uncultured Roseobacter sp.]|uniref:pentapeptide repeat-containing protein n=1 Tax=uncultured Roseobacter sp. TaxID=114847 RepID=UPI0026330341|nr:pentapeptide repeat-containing protein [uncultured Roseobacter sp.]